MISKFWLIVNVPFHSFILQAHDMYILRSCDKMQGQYTWFMHEVKLLCLQTTA